MGTQPGASSPRAPRPRPAAAATETQIAALKALSDATRLRIVRLLHREELNVQELCAILQLAQPRVSRHLAVLRGTGLVCDRREGTRVFYRLPDLPEALKPLNQYIDALAQSDHPDLDRLQDCLQSRTRCAHAFADHKADQWDAVGRRLHSPAASLLAMASLAPRGLIVGDMGTGTGLMLPFLSPLADRVYAVDHSAEMLRHARDRCQQMGIANVTLVNRAIEELDQEVPPCDAVLLHFVLHQVARPASVVRHLARLLKPGGRLVVVDRVQHQDEQAKVLFGSLWLGFDREQLQRWFAEARLTAAGWLPVPGQGTADGPHLDAFVATATRDATGPDA